MRKNPSGFAAALIAGAMGFVVPSVASAAAPDPLDTWSTSTTLGTGPTPALPIAFENGLFYMPSGTGRGFSGSLRSSRDGITWSGLMAMLPLTSPNALGYANNTYVFGCRNGDVYTSTTGTTWTKSGPTINTALTALVYGNGLWVFSGGQGVMTSRDLAAWSYAQIPGQTVASTGIAFANGLFVATSSQGIATSPDAVSWTRRVPGVSLSAVAFAKGLFVAVGPAGAVETSTDGSTWTRGTGPAANANLTSVAYGDGGWVAVGNLVGSSAVVYASRDGAAWSAHSFTPSANLESIAFGNGAYVISGLGPAGITAYASGAYTTAAPVSITNVHTVLTSPGPIALPAAPAGPVLVHKP